MPYRHLKILDHERTHHLIQDQEQNIPLTKMQHEISDIRHIIEIIDRRHIPTDGLLRFYPVLSAALGGENKSQAGCTFHGVEGRLRVNTLSFI